MIPDIVRLFLDLKPVQQKIFHSITSSNKRKHVIHSSRRLGKSHALCVISIASCLSKSQFQVRYASVTQKAVRKIIHPIMKSISLKLPVNLRPEWKQQEGAYVFSNGSMIHVAGVNNGHADDMRGTHSDLFIVDEAGFVDELSYLIDSVAMPQLLTCDGKLILSSSSPLSPSHEFARYIQEARSGEFYSSYTIHDGGYDPDIIQEFCLEAGGKDSTAWRREYLNHLIVDDQFSIIPEWKKDFIGEPIKDEFFPHYHRYASMDIGVRDKTVILWGTYNFREARLYVQKEWWISGPQTTTRAISEGIKEAEADFGQMYKRVADNNNLILLQDLGQESGIHFLPTSKESLAAMVNEVRIWVSQDRLRVSKECEQLLGCLEFGVYSDQKRNMFGRSSNFGHFDALASLIYMIRNIDTHTNPIPKTHGSAFDVVDLTFNETEYELSKIFKR